MAPQCALLLPISHTSCDFVRLEMPTSTNILKHPLFLPYNSFLSKILHGKFFGAIYGCGDGDCAVLKPYCYSRLKRIKVDAATKDRLSGEVGGRESQCERRVSVNIGERGLQHCSSYIRRSSQFITGVFIQRHDRLLKAVKKYRNVSKLNAYPNEGVRATIGTCKTCHLSEIYMKGLQIEKSSSSKSRVQYSMSFGNICRYPVGGVLSKI